MTWYTGDFAFDTLLTTGLVFALFVFISSRYGTAKYGGRFGGGGKGGFKLGSKPGWILMELPGLLVFPVVFFMGSNSMETVPLFFLAIWMMHYCNRALITPLLMRTRPDAQSDFDISVILLGWVSLALHGYLNARYISELGDHYQPEWFSDPRFIIGLAIYAFGFMLNIISDSILRNLRSKVPDVNEPRYKTPYGWGFKFVSCPQYLGEIISFIGIAMMTWNLGAVFVIAITIGNLVPRALYTHKWFKKNFEDYPAERKAIVPYVL